MGAVNTRRRYNSPERRARFDRTRETILQAAERLFADAGYESTTMEAVARRASVSVATIYLHFRTKPALIAGLVQAAVESPELDVHRVLGETNPRRMGQIAAANMRQLHERTIRVTDILRSAKDSGTELAGEWEKWQKRHLWAVSRVAEELRARGFLRAGLSAAQAADILYVLAGSETYRQFVQERGWSPARYQRWFEDAAQRLLRT